MKESLKKILSFILKTESRLVIWKYKPKIIAITGSVGKTSTKDAVYAVLSGISYVRKSEKSYNSEIGLPLTILGCPNGWSSPSAWIKIIVKGMWLFLAPHRYPKWLVLEVGVGKPGDMKRTASWLKTDAVIITAIGETPAHIEFFNGRKHVIDEKSRLIKTLKKGGILILNRDDEDVLNMKVQSKEKDKHRVITYGFSDGADIQGSGYNLSYGEDGKIEGFVFRADEGGISLPVATEGVLGRNNAYASLAALAFSFGLKFNMLFAVDSLHNYDLPPGRMRLLKGVHNSVIIDDTYNSSPVACKSALKTLKEIESKGRKIAILGDMLELGRHTEEAHRNIGRIAGGDLTGTRNALIVVGFRAQSIKEGAIEAGMSPENIFEFIDSRKASEFAASFVKENDLILVKGSQGMRMERVVEVILSDHKNKDKLLVRQEREWKRR